MTGSRVVGPNRGSVVGLAPNSGPATQRLRIGLNLTTLTGTLLDGEVAQVVESTALLCSRRGQELGVGHWTFDGPALAHALGNSMLLELAQLAAQLSKMKGVPAEATGLEPLHVRMAEAGRMLPPQAAVPAEQVFQEVQARYADNFAKFDLIISPTLAKPPPKLGVLVAPDRPIELVLSTYLSHSPYTTVAIVAGAPAMSVPLRLSSERLPIGVQFFAPFGEGRRLLELAYELEMAGPWRPQ